MKHYVYRIPNALGVADPSASCGMVSIPDETYMHRVPEGAIETSEHPVPEDQTGEYFEAWRINDDGGVYIDFDEAKNIRLEQIRARRDKMFEGLDAQQFRAYCSKDDKKIEALEEEKELLRNVPDRIDWDSVKTVRELSYVMPPELI